MHVYEITLPLKTNSGVSARAAHRAYRAWLLDTFGGYSQRQCAGVWRDDKGQTFRDLSAVYSVAAGPNAPYIGALAAQAMRLFPDQLAFYVAKVGEAEIIVRGGKPCEPEADIASAEADR